MTITARPYANHDDLRLIQIATTHWIAAAGFCGYLHVGDIALRLFNGMRHYDPTQIVHLWHDEHGVLLAWALVYPRWDSYEALLHPAYRDAALAVQVIDWAENETRRWMEQEGRADHHLILNVYADDAPRIALLHQRGYQFSAQHSTIGQRSLLETLPNPQLPEGFKVRALAGIHEVDKLVEAQNAAFGWSWTTDALTRVFCCPDIKPEREWVVVAPDGQFAAFCFIMLDAHNKMGMFEDVGTHPNFRRLGLGRALLFAGMRHMQMQEMETALVPYHVSAGAGKALYESVGFQPVYSIADYVKAP